jgi:hypothetical protein
MRLFLASILNLVLFHWQLCLNIKVLKKLFLNGPLLGEVGLYCIVLRLRGIKIIFNIGQIFFTYLNHIQYDPFIFAKHSFSKIRSINCDRDGFMC